MTGCMGKNILWTGAVFLVFLLNIHTATSQSLPGTTGYFNIPSAEIYPDRSFFAGANLLNKEYKKWGNPDYHAMDFFVTTTFVPFVELSIRFSRMIDLPEELYSSTVGDRMASLRVRPLKEGRYHPAVVVGLQNFFTTLQSGDASHFNSTYIVLTKNFHLNTFIDRVGVTAGYGSDLFTAADYQFIGLFGGINFSPKNMEFLELMMEYDADKWNAGARITILKHVVILAGLEGLDAFSGGISYKLTLP
ncbi:MAG: YjbH domain-containing protein [Bacteroidales bacterium]|nr:YjbH domain-containing protein [Bacteroidales bacterium]